MTTTESKPKLSRKGLGALCMPCRNAEAGLPLCSVASKGPLSGHGIGRGVTLGMSLTSLNFSERRCPCDCHKPKAETAPKPTPAREQSGTVEAKPVVTIEERREMFDEVFDKVYGRRAKSIADARARREQLPKVKEMKHGTRNSYDRLGCRCEKCRAANTTHVLKARGNMPELPKGDPRHGTRTGYINFTCRCDKCVEANSDYQAAAYLRRKAKAKRAGTVERRKP